MRTLKSVAAIGTALALAIGLAVAVPESASATDTATLYGWGNDTSVSNATTAIGSGSVASVSVWGSHGVALLSDGSVVEWGGADDGTTIASAVGDHTAVQVAAGDNFGLALLSDGTIVGWGEDQNGILSGISAANGAGTITQISASAGTALALTSNGDVVGWGLSGSGQTDTQHFGEGTVKQIVSSGSSSFAVMNDGSVNAWGFVPSSQSAAIGSGGIASIAASNDHNIALKSDGTAVAWGFDVTGAVVSCLASAIPNGETATAVAAGLGFNALLLSDGSVVTCGDTVPAATDPDPAGVATQIATGDDTVYKLGVAPTITIDNSEDISDGTIAPGAQLGITGSNFLGNVPIVESIDGTQYATGSTGPTGALSTFDALPATLTTAAHTLTVSVGGQVFTFTLHIAPGFVTATPTITGTTKVDATLTAHPGTWATDTTFSYQWFSNGKSVSSPSPATTYTLQSSDSGKKITVKLTGTPHGFPATVKAVTKTSASTKAITPGDLLIIIDPYIYTAPIVGQRVSVSPGAWGPSPTFSYQWLANGVAIKGATTSSWPVTGSVAGKMLTVAVTGKESGYTPKTVVVGPTTFVALGTLVTGNVQLTGSAIVGSKLTLAAPGFGKGVTSSYQWLRSGDIIPGATSSSYTVTTADRENQLGLEVTGYELGYQGSYNTSAPTAAVMTSAVPTISGTTTVGSTLTASPGTWTPGVGLKFEWLRISGKTSTVIQSTTYSDTDSTTNDSYKLVAADLGKTIEVRVSGMQGGYDSAVQTSKATSKIG